MSADASPGSDVRGACHKFELAWDGLGLLGRKYYAPIDRIVDIFERGSLPPTESAISPTTWLCFTAQFWGFTLVIFWWGRSPPIESAYMVLAAVGAATVSCRLAWYRENCIYIVTACDSVEIVPWRFPRTAWKWYWYEYDPRAWKRVISLLTPTVVRAW